MTPRLAAAGLSLLGGLLVSACEAPNAPPLAAPPPSELPTAPSVPPTTASGGWRTIATGEVAGLTYADGSNRAVITLACRAGELRVLVPGFRKIGSEDRLTVGAGDEAFALVADLASSEPGVLATGAIPPDLINRIAREQTIAATYGTQTIDPLPGPGAETSLAFISACRAG